MFCSGVFLYSNHHVQEVVSQKTRGHHCHVLFRVGAFLNEDHEVVCLDLPEAWVFISVSLQKCCNTIWCLEKTLWTYIFWPALSLAQISYEDFNVSRPLNKFTIGISIMIRRQAEHDVLFKTTVSKSDVSFLLPAKIIWELLYLKGINILI